MGTRQIQTIKTLRKDLYNLTPPVNHASGTYIIWVRKNDAIALMKSIPGLYSGEIQTRQINGAEYLALYFGISKDLLKRAKWHFCQRHTESNVRSKTLSTLRQTISALLGINMTSSQNEVNAFFERACYWEWNYAGSFEEAKQIETEQLRKCYYPLNIQENRNVNTEQIHALKERRRKYNY